MSMSAVERLNQWEVQRRALIEAGAMMFFKRVAESMLLLQSEREITTDQSSTILETSDDSQPLSTASHFGKSVLHTTGIVR